VFDNSIVRSILNGLTLAVVQKEIQRTSVKMNKLVSDVGTLLETSGDEKLPHRDTLQSSVSVFVWFSKLAFSSPVKFCHICWIRHFDSIIFVWSFVTRGRMDHLVFRIMLVWLAKPMT
jgi:hypothetical protein